MSPGHTIDSFAVWAPKITIYCLFLFKATTTTNPLFSQEANNIFEVFCHH